MQGGALNKLDTSSTLKVTNHCNLSKIAGGRLACLCTLNQSAKNRYECHGRQRIETFSHGKTFVDFVLIVAQSLWTEPIVCAFRTRPWRPRQSCHSRQANTSHSLAPRCDYHCQTHRNLWLWSVNIYNSLEATPIFRASIYLIFIGT